MDQDAATATEDQKQKLVDAITMLERAKIIDFNGHFSARVPGSEHMMINSGASVRSALTREDIITIDLDGRNVAGSTAPPVEFHIHTEIYRRRPDVQAILHSHPLWSTVLNIAGHDIQPVIMQSAVLGEIRRFDTITSINSREFGRALAETLGNNRIVVLKSHGAVVAAEGILEAFVLAVYVEETAERQYRAMQVGTPTVLSAEEIRTIKQN
ncbi:MAG TPA: class II aldolase/adducin family protein, partial [Xanthobacteraceae bacterium]|nr:class II aldolase/adducin family protein [Xanthobacteraceae bacterium]